MNNWKQIKEIAKVRRGASPRPISDSKYFGGEVGWVRIVDVTKSTKFLRKTEQYVSKLGESKSIRVDKGDVVMSICGTIGRPIIIDMPACIHDGFVHFYDINSTDSEYLYYILQFEEENLINKGQPGTQVNLNTTIVGNHKIYHPPLPEQQKIAKILRTVDGQIEKTQATIAKYKAIKQGLMQDLLNPESWNDRHEIKLKDQANILSGFPFSSDKFSNEHGTPLIRIRDLLSSKPETYYLGEYMNTYIVSAGDILIGMDGEYHIVRWKGTNALLNQRILKVEAFPQGLLDNSFLYYFLQPIIKDIENKTAATTVKHLSINDLAKRRFLVPNRNQQEEIGFVLTKTDNKIEKELSVWHKLKEIKKGLMSDLLSGKVRVQIDEEAVC